MTGATAKAGPKAATGGVHMAGSYIPTTEDVRRVWAAFNGYGGLVDRPHSVMEDEARDEFDRWLERVRRGN